MLLLFQTRVLVMMWMCMIGAGARSRDRVQALGGERARASNCDLQQEQDIRPFPLSENTREFLAFHVHGMQLRTVKTLTSSAHAATTHTTKHLQHTNAHNCEDAHEGKREGYRARQT